MIFTYTGFSKHLDFSFLYSGPPEEASFERCTVERVLNGGKSLLATGEVKEEKKKEKLGQFFVYLVLTSKSQ